MASDTVVDLGLAGARTVVVGAGQGIGLECVRVLSALGAHVTCVDRDRERAEFAAALVRQSSGRGVALVADVCEPSEAERVVTDAVETLGGLDVVINIVGLGGPTGAVAAMTDDVWTEALRINLDQQFYLIRAALRPMITQRRGSMVLISSINGLRCAPLRAAYGAAKAGLISLAKTVAVEAAEHGVRINTVAPGATATPRVRQVTDDSSGQFYRDAIPLGRMAEPVEVARAAVFLASDFASYVTGETLVVDGGASLRSSLHAGR